MKPNMQDVVATMDETMRLFFRASRMPGSNSSFLYQFKVNPFQGRLANLSTLKEKMIIVIIGMKRKINTRDI
jgi:hypothetical protein